MKPLPHRYAVRLHGGPSGYAQVCAPGLPGLRTAPPVDFDGPGDAWSPEHLLLAAVESCFLFTLRPIARLSKVDFTAVDVDASGTVDRGDGVTRFSEIVLRTRVTVAPGANVERVRHILDQTKKACLISASLSVPVHLESQIVQGLMQGESDGRDS